MIRAEILTNRPSPATPKEPWLAIHLSGEHKVSMDRIAHDMSHLDSLYFVNYADPALVSIFLGRYKYVWLFEPDEIYLWGQEKLFETIAAWPLTYAGDTPRLEDFSLMILDWTRTTKAPLQSASEIIGWDELVAKRLRANLFVGEAGKDL